MIFKQDLQFGFKAEDDLFSMIKEKYGDNICKTQNNCRVDYESEDVLIELKSRRNTSKKYPRTRSNFWARGTPEMSSSHQEHSGDI